MLATLPHSRNHTAWHCDTPQLGPIQLGPIQLFAISITFSHVRPALIHCCHLSQAYAHLLDQARFPLAEVQAQCRPPLLYCHPLVVA
jgi:hypothetical protein